VALQKRADVVGQLFGQHRGRGDDTHAALRAAGEVAQFGMHARHGGQHFARLAQQGLAGGGGLDAAAAAHQQRRADVGFDGGDALADRAGDDGLALGSARDVALLADGDEQVQGDGVEGSCVGCHAPRHSG
jgi:hypothetical protein